MVTSFSLGVAVSPRAAPSVPCWTTAPPADTSFLYSFMVRYNVLG